VHTKCGQQHTQPFDWFDRSLFTGSVATISRRDLARSDAAEDTNQSAATTKNSRQVSTVRSKTAFRNQNSETVNLLEIYPIDGAIWIVLIPDWRWKSQPNSRTGNLTRTTQNAMEIPDLWQDYPQQISERNN
jgi:hypothetical protein